jgi:nicotinamidase-related amidase
MDRRENHDPLTPLNCCLILINYQAKLAAAVNSIEEAALFTNMSRLARAAITFHLPTILTTIGAASFGGPMLPQLRDAFPTLKSFDCDRKSIWEDHRVVAAARKAGRKKLVLAGLWTDFPVVFSAIQALDSGYEVYVVRDACGDLTLLAHDLAIRQLVRVGGFSITGLETLLLLQQGTMQEELTGLASQRAAAMGLYRELN